MKSLKKKLKKVKRNDVAKVAAVTGGVLAGAGVLKTIVCKLKNKEDSLMQAKEEINEETEPQE